MSYSSGLQRKALFSIALVLFIFILIINLVLNMVIKKEKEVSGLKENISQTNDKGRSNQCAYVSGSGYYNFASGVSYRIYSRTAAHHMELF